jgi:AcrR family transcriptional regulator
MDAVATRPPSLDYTEHLMALAERARAPSKGERTRLRVTAAASRILAEKGYHLLRMADIAQEAGVSHGAVYRYFRNKREVAFEVFHGHAEWGVELMYPPEHCTTAYQRIHATTSKFIDQFRSNIGLMRCLRQLCDQIPEFDQLQMKNNASWYRLVASGMARRAGTTERAAEEALGVACALGGMVDEMLHNVFVREDPTLAHFRRAPAALATVLSILWYRAAYAANPPTEEVGGGHALLELRGPETKSAPVGAESAQ